LIEHARIPADKLIEHGNEICRISPALYKLDLRRPADCVNGLLSYEMPAQIREIDLSSNSLGTSDPRGSSGPSRILRSKWLAQIEMLDLQCNYLSPDDIRELTGNRLPNLRTLDLEMNLIGIAIEQLASWPSLGNVTDLSLKSCSIADDGLAILCVSPFVANLRRLNLASCAIANVRPIARTESFHSLEFLSLRNNNLRPNANGLLEKALSLPDGMTLDYRKTTVEPTENLKSKFRVIA
jgi:hypothetical protein